MNLQQTKELLMNFKLTQKLLMDLQHVKEPLMERQRTKELLLDMLNPNNTCWLTAFGQAWLQHNKPRAHKLWLNEQPRLAAHVSGRVLTIYFFFANYTFGLSEFDTFVDAYTPGIIIELPGFPEAWRIWLNRSSKPTEIWEYQKSYSPEV